MTATAPAPEFTHALTWVNSDPLRLAELRGRVVLLWFWHGGSALCHNVLDDLRHLQARHGAALCVVGIHVPKFEAERDPRQVLKLVNRLDIRFPVASDADFVAWQHYGMAGWPATLVLDRQGCVRKVLAGDLRRSELEAATEALLRESASTDAMLDEPFRPTQHPEARLPLAFPSGLAVTAAQLYIADTAHHRILECAHDGRVLRQFGSGQPGFLDGGSGDAAFSSPRGLAVWKDALYVADTGNHALRRVQLSRGEVDTVAGTGRPGLADAGAVDPRQSPLNAPWDLAASHDQLYIAMAGAQQVWAFDLNRRLLRVLAGSGRIALADGSATQAGFGQPAALALVQHTLYVADAGASAIRTVNTAEGGVQTLIGQDLFEFGDADGTRSAARLQAPMGLALDPRSPILWIADTFNHSLRMLRLGGGDLRRFELDFRLQEPTALAATEGALWLANSAAHEVLRIEPDSGAVQRLPVGE